MSHKWIQIINMRPEFETWLPFFWSFWIIINGARILLRNFPGETPSFGHVEWNQIFSYLWIPSGTNCTCGFDDFCLNLYIDRSMKIWSDSISASATAYLYFFLICFFDLNHLETWNLVCFLNISSLGDQPARTGIPWYHSCYPNGVHSFFGQTACAKKSL